MYNASKPTSKATRADKPSYTPGQRIKEFVSLSILRSLVAGDSFAALIWLILDVDMATGCRP